MSEARGRAEVAPAVWQEVDTDSRSSAELKGFMSSPSVRYVWSTYYQVRVWRVVQLEQRHGLECGSMRLVHRHAHGYVWPCVDMQQLDRSSHKRIKYKGQLDRPSHKRFRLRNQRSGVGFRRATGRRA